MIQRKKLEQRPWGMLLCLAPSGLLSYVFHTAQAQVHRAGTTHSELGLPTHQLAIKKLPHRQAEGTFEGGSSSPENLSSQILCEVVKK